MSGTCSNQVSSGSSGGHSRSSVKPLVIRVERRHHEVEDLQRLISNDGTVSYARWYEDRYPQLGRMAHAIQFHLSLTFEEVIDLRVCLVVVRLGVFTDADGVECALSAVGCLCT